jgi:FdhD protein
MPRQIPIVKWCGSEFNQDVDLTADEEPLTITVNDESLTLTMRTPGSDWWLALGLLYCEGLIQSAEDVDDWRLERHTRLMGDTDVLSIALHNRQALPKTGWERRFPSTSSCGVCGKTDLQSIDCLAAPNAECTPVVSPNIIYGLPDRMRAAQRDFRTTGGLHAAALFSETGELLTVHEDIGRHNAVDKVVGEALEKGLMPPIAAVLMTSGRSSFEILQKAAVARIPIVCAVSAPSSLAVRLAHDLNITLAGFVRGESMNVYSAPSRISSSPR